MDVRALGATGRPLSTRLVLVVSRSIRMIAAETHSRRRSSSLRKAARSNGPRWPSGSNNWCRTGLEGFEVPDTHNAPLPMGWRFQVPEGSAPCRREALVLVVSRYEGGFVTSLPGAAHDERRIAAMFATNGFSVTQGIDPDRATILRALTAFARRRSERSESSVIYSTGHGVEADASTYLLPGDYPQERGYRRSTLERHAIRVDRLAMALRGRSANLLLFAGCRTWSRSLRTCAEVRTAVGLRVPNHRVWEPVPNGLR